MDMLIKLYALPQLGAAVDYLKAHGICVRRAMAYERRQTIAWVQGQFNDLWADECAVSFGRQPIGCYVAVGNQGPVGFCCTESTFRNFIGPIGVAADWRRRGIGRALVLTALWRMHDDGYAYAVAGDVGRPEFFIKTVDAVEIAGSTPGSYPPRNMGTGKQ